MSQWNRTCQKCKKYVRANEPDPCLGYLPGVAHACCGHGIDNNAYVTGFPGCKPDELLSNPDAKWVPQLLKIKRPDGEVDLVKNPEWKISEQFKPGTWIHRGRQALKYMEELKNGKGRTPVFNNQEGP